MFPQMSMMPGSPGQFQMPPDLGQAAMPLSDPIGMAGLGRGVEQGPLDPMANLLLTLLTKGGVQPLSAIGGDGLMQLLASMGGMGGQQPQQPMGGMMPGGMGGMMGQPQMPPGC